ncbi:formimidoylglutamase [Myroides phaeus]|uniref:Arginase family enzyme n=1 Tax=Myroides phaeus TaxID=702745 RepID=A0A1G8BI34_9FLAO|nr:formimidoylglutamase [Myroides phaeus]MEC4116935.1 formimidoylglutamase [Myroides phaeus]SDH32877.1 Arginase family enzyme [Myroides phaeus]
MLYELLRPIGDELINFIDGLPSQSLGKKITFFSGGNFENYSRYRIAIIGVIDNRGFNNDDDIVDLSKIRKAFYALFPGNWSTNMIDLGDILPGEQLQDTYFLLKTLVGDLVKNGVIPIVIGGSQDMTYAIYRGYDKLEQMVNLVSIDAKLDLAKEGSFPAESFLSRIIMEEPVNLFNFSNIGYQTYFNAQEEIDLIESLYFEAYRVGEITKNIKLAEPVLRDADIISIDMGVVKSGDSGNFDFFNPNGFDGKEICSLARYSGLSDRVSSFGIFNYNNNKNETLLIAQILWYFVEGVNFRSNEYPFVSKESYLKYIVPVEGYDDLIFFKSDVSERWWVEAPVFFNNTEKKVLLPCSYDDYELAISQNVPERWWRTLKKSLL